MNPIGINLTKCSLSRVGTGAAVERSWGPCGYTCLPDRVPAVALHALLPPADQMGASCPDHCETVASF
jgi:hypothetical protein